MSQDIYATINALESLGAKFDIDKSSITVTGISNASRTADIEKTLVLGAHGPKELVVFLSLV